MHKASHQKELLTDLEAMLDHANASLENKEISAGALGELAKLIMSLLLLCYSCDEKSSRVEHALTIEGVLIEADELEERSKKSREKKKSGKVISIDSKKK